MVVTKTQRFEDVTEEETMALLKGDLENKQIEFLWTKLRMFRPEDAWYFVPVFSRNLQALISDT
jgi:hypothetical protein